MTPALTSRLSELRSLYIWSSERVLYSGSSWSLTLPHLQRLYLTELRTSPEVAGHFLTSTTLPSLSTLAFALCDVEEPVGAEDWFTSTSAPVVHQLQSLSTSYNIESGYQQTSLVFLDCWYAAVTRHTIRHLPPSLRFLRLNPMNNFQPRSDTFAEGWAEYEHSVLLKLEELHAPVEYREDSMFDPLRGMCKKKGVRLVYEKRPDWATVTSLYEDAAFDQAFWSLAGKAERVLAEERRRGLEC